MPVNKKVHQYINAITFKFVNNACRHYFNEVYEYATHCRIESRSNFAKLKVPYRKTNMGQNGLSYIGSTLWNNLPGSLKKATVLNTFKHNLKQMSWQFSWKLGFIGLLLVFTYIPNPFIYLFICVFIYLFISLFSTYISFSFF